MATMFPFQQDSLVLQPSKAKLIPPLLVMMGVGAGGVWLVQRGTPAGWLVATAGGAGSLLAGAQLLLNNTFLWLTPDGLTVSTVFGARHLKWSDVEWCVSTKRGVQIRYTADRRIKTVAMMSESYGMRPRELADLLNRWRVRGAREARAS